MHPHLAAYESSNSAHFFLTAYIRLQGSSIERRKAQLHSAGVVSVSCYCICRWKCGLSAQKPFGPLVLSRRNGRHQLWGLTGSSSFQCHFQDMLAFYGLNSQLFDSADQMRCAGQENAGLQTLPVSCFPCTIQMCKWRFLDIYALLAYTKEEMSGKSGNSSFISRKERVATYVDSGNTSYTVKLFETVCGPI